MSKTIFKLWSIRSVSDFGRVQTYSRTNVLSMVTICEKLTTEVLSNLDTPFSRRKFPCARSRSRFDVSITIQPLQGHQAVIAEYHRQVLTESLHTHHPVMVVPAREPQHNANHEATQATEQACFHHEYLILQFAYIKYSMKKEKLQG